MDLAGSRGTDKKMIITESQGVGVVQPAHNNPSCMSGQVENETVSSCAPLFKGTLFLYGAPRAVIKAGGVDAKRRPHKVVQMYRVLRNLRPRCYRRDRPLRGEVAVYDPEAGVSGVDNTDMIVVDGVNAVGQRLIRTLHNEALYPRVVYPSNEVIGSGVERSIEESGSACLQIGSLVGPEHLTLIEIEPYERILCSETAQQNLH